MSDGKIVFNSENEKPKIELREHKKIGVVKGMIDVDAYRVGRLDERKSCYLSVEVTGENEISHTSIVDSVEIPEVIYALKELSKINTSFSKITNFEVSYKTKHELKFTVFNQIKSNTMLLIIRSGHASVFSSIDILSRLISIFEVGKVEIHQLETT